MTAGTREAARISPADTNPKEVREAVHAAFAAAADQRPLPADAIAALDSMACAAFCCPSLALRDGRAALMWDAADPRLGFVVRAVVRAAVELLTSRESLARVRVCAAEDCGWLFLDTSRNGSRRWCDMTVCGNRAKARRHYQRVQGKG